MRNILISLFGCLATTGVALAGEVPTYTADAIVQHFDKLSPGSEGSFENWVYNTALFAATTCWKDAYKGKGIDLPGALDKRVKMTNAFSYPERPGLFCGGLARSGFNPICSLEYVDGPSRQTNSNVPRDYLVLAELISKPVLSGRFKCYLNKEREQAQTYFGPVDVSWSNDPVSMINMQTPTGMYAMSARTIVLSHPKINGLNGKPFEASAQAVQAR